MIIGKESMMRFLSHSRRIVRAHWSAYITINHAYYSLVQTGMGYSLIRPLTQQQLMATVGEALASTGLLTTVAGAYLGQHFPLAVILTLTINLGAGAFLVITLPSCVIPFFGLVVGGCRALLWGLLLAPQGPLAGPMVPHSLTLLLEGQGYVLAMLGTWISGLATLRPRTFGLESHWRGYILGVKETVRLYPLIALALSLAALYEAFEVIYIVSRGIG